MASFKEQLTQHRKDSAHQAQSHVNGAGTKVYGKIEGRNPSYSVKCRIGASMIWDAEQRGLLKPAWNWWNPPAAIRGSLWRFVAASRGYSITLTMPETMSLERRKVLKAFGANLVLTEGRQGNAPGPSPRRKRSTIRPEHYLLLQQFKNPANPAIHFSTTGPEIWDDTNGEVDVLVSGVGTGGTITGVSRYIKQTRARRSRRWRWNRRTAR